MKYLVVNNRKHPDDLQGQGHPSHWCTLAFALKQTKVGPFSGCQFPEISQRQLKMPEVEAVYKTRNRSNIVPEFTSGLMVQKSPRHTHTHMVNHLKSEELICD